MTVMFLHLDVKPTNPKTDFIHNIQDLLLSSFTIGNTDQVDMGRLISTQIPLIAPMFLIPAMKLMGEHGYGMNTFRWAASVADDGMTADFLIRGYTQSTDAAEFHFVMVDEGTNVVCIVGDCCLHQERGPHTHFTLMTGEVFDRLLEREVAEDAAASEAAAH